MRSHKLSAESAKSEESVVMVVGAGIAGIRAALDLAETGHKVLLIDKSPHIGGILSQLDYQFPSDHCGMCRMLPMINRDDSSQYCLRKGLFHENIEILLSTEIISIDGESGNFNITLRQKNEGIDSQRCIGCGICVSVCPVDVPDEFNEGLSYRKAIYLPVPHAVPSPYIIDAKACTRCGACVAICPTHAISMSSQERKQFRILVVDDEMIVRSSLMEILDTEGYSAEMAESGQNALEKLEQQPYQLMLTDIKMPGMDGVELLQKAKSLYPDLPVVMMTAYATVETAVEAMKIGALEYLIKPFDTEAIIDKVFSVYEKFELVHARKEEVGAIILAGGTGFYDPKQDRNTYDYGHLPNVMTSLEFERMFSGTGPTQGNLVRLSDGKPIRKIAWLQCVGSRDIQTNADFCSSVCCMFSIKEARIVKEKSNGSIETVLFYMDMRTDGKSFQRYRDQAESLHGIRFERAKVHSIAPDADAGDLMLRYTDISGKLLEETADMVVLAVGQRPSSAAKLAESAGIGLNPWGFVQTSPFSPSKTNRPGIFIGGSFSGLKDISESVIQASAAAFNASKTMQSAKCEVQSVKTDALLLQKPPRILVAVCVCGKKFSPDQELVKEWMSDPAVIAAEFTDQICSGQGEKSLAELVGKHKPDQVLIAACLPYVYGKRRRELCQRIGTDPLLTEVVDISSMSDSEMIRCVVGMGIEKLRRMEDLPAETLPVKQKALIVGGGIAGMTAALGIADHGFEVELVEQGEKLGGNLLWLNSSIEGYSMQTLLEETLPKVEKHPLIHVHTQTRVVSSYGQAGDFITTIESKETGVQTIAHGVSILAVGGTEAIPTAYGYGKSSHIVTQKELEEKFRNKTIDPLKLSTVVMIQCVGSREEPRNYCSRVCCPTSLKHALYLKEQNPDIDIYVLYRDMMSCGFAETYYTQARKAGVIFIQYQAANKPEVEISGDEVRVIADEPIIGRKIEIAADLLVLAAGIVPNLPNSLSSAFGISSDQDGFFQEADSKWRPTDSMTEGIFACGLAHSPRSVSESVATAEAAAQRALRILTKNQLSAGSVTAKVHHSLCSLCERCIEACPYEARMIDPEEEKVVVNPARCQGCGSCATVCPNGASYIQGFSRQQMLAVVDAAFA